MTALTVRVSEETAEKLGTLAKAQDRSLSSIAARAIEEFVARETWQVAEIQSGFDEAERGDFASEDDVRTIVARYGASGR